MAYVIKGAACWHIDCPAGGITCNYPDMVGEPCEECQNPMVAYPTPPSVKREFETWYEQTAYNMSY